MSDGTIKLGIELDESGLKKDLNNVKKTNKKTFEEMAKETGKSVDEIKAEVKKLAEAYEKEGLFRPVAYKKAYKELGFYAKKNSEEVKKEAEKIEESYKKSFSSISSVAKKGFGGLGAVASVGISAIGTGIKAVVGTATAAVGGLVALGAATADYRDEQARLNSAFESAGYSTEVAKQAYNDFYAILGESDTAVEASQLLAKLSNSEQDMTKWTNIAAGVWATYGDALPIEGLIESANETAKVGQVTGTLADALNWAGISEDEFNTKLASAGSEAERNQLIMATLSGEYQNAANIFKENNSTLMEARKVQADLMDSLSELGGAVTNIQNKILAGFGPSINSIVQAFTNLINGVDGADDQLATAISGFATKLAEQLPHFLEFGGQILIALVKGLIQNLPTLLETGAQLLINLQEGILNNLPSLVDGARQFLETFSKFVIENLPTIYKNGNDILIQLINGLIDNLPLIINTAIDVILALVDGLVDALPELIPACVEAILTIVDALIDNLDKIIDGAVELMLALAVGLIDAIPILVEKVPEIITKLVAELTKPDIMIKLTDAGIQLILALIEGCFKMNVGLAKAAWNSVQEFVKGLFSEETVNDVKDAGKDLIRGLIEGVESMTSEMFDTVKEFCGNVINDVKDFFGIHSPSRLFRDEIGVMLVKGMIVGVKKENSNLIDTIVSPFKDIQDTIKKQKNVFSKNITNVISIAQKKANKEAKNFGETGEILVNSLSENINTNKENAINSMNSLIDDMLETSNKNIDEKSQGLIDNYTNAINLQIKNNTISKESGENLIKDYTETVKATAEEEKEELKTTGTELMDSFKSSIETGANQVNELINQKLSVLSDNFQTEMNSLIEAQESLESSLSDTKLFEFEDNQLVIENLDETINKLNQYDDAISSLKEKGISDTILNELSSYSVDEVLAISKTLLDMTDDEFKKLNEKWAEKQATAATVASNFYKEQMEILEKDFNKELTKTLNELPDEVENIGIMTITGFQNGLQSKMSNIKSEVESFCQEVLDKMQSTLDIHSPSRETEWMGKMLDEGFSNGIKKGEKGILKAIKNLSILDAFKQKIPYLQGAVNTTLSNMIPKGASHTSNFNSTNNITNNQGDFIVNIQSLENKGSNSIRTFLQEASFYQRQKEQALGV